MQRSRVLYITQEMFPYIGSENEISKISRELPQAMLEKGWEIRNFMPRYGLINERRHQLHEVIRLSGMNIIVNDSDQPLIIKVASIPSARIQVYFIDNDEYFKRKFTTHDENNAFYADNDERAIFFCKGVLETVKKLGWAPDIIHCHGWMTSLIPYFIRTAYKEDPTFIDAKIGFSLFDSDKFEGNLGAAYASKASNGINDNIGPAAELADYKNLIKSGIKYADFVVRGQNTIDSDINEYIVQSEKRSITLSGTEPVADELHNFYKEIMEEESILAE